MSERCRGCGTDLDAHPPVSVHASVAGRDWVGVADADVLDTADRLEECAVCMIVEPRAVDGGGQDA